MRILAIDTSSATASAAVAFDGCLVDVRRFNAPRGRGAEIFTTLEDMRAFWTGLDRLAVGIGPGSYNGLRVACALAGSFQAALQVDVVAVPSCCLLDVETPSYIAAGDARGGRVWWAEVHDRRLRGDIALLTHEELAQRTGKLSLPIYRTGEIRGFETVTQAAPDAAVLAVLAASLPAVIRHAQITPLYLKPPHITAPKSSPPWLASMA